MAVSIITQVVVDKNDSAFNNPIKPIGKFHTRKEVIELKKSHPNWIFIFRR
jgi:carbamate kinase